MKALFYIIVVYAVIPTNFCLSGEVSKQNQQDQANKIIIFELHEKLSEIEKKMERQKELIDKLDSKLNLVTGQQKATLENISEKIQGNRKDIKEVAMLHDQFRQMVEQSLKMNQIGSILILLALLFEVPGAILLAGANLAHDQPHVFSLSLTPDLVKAWSFGYEKVWDRLSFFGLLASFFLIIGFLMQVTGISLILSLSLQNTVLFISIAIIICFLIVYFLLGQHPDQSRKEKIKVFYLNLKRLFPLTNTIKCDYCSKRISSRNSQVWWVKAPDSGNNPYGKDLKKMHLGHNECLEKSGWYNHIGNDEKIFKVLPIDFLENYLQNLESWWAGKRENSNFEKGKKIGGTQYDYEFINITKRIRRLAT